MNMDENEIVSRETRNAVLDQKPVDINISEELRDWAFGFMGFSLVALLGSVILGVCFRLFRLVSGL